MSDLENICAHALHNAFITTERVSLDWPKEGTHHIEQGVVINVERISIVPTDCFYMPFEIWVAVTWEGMPEQEYLTEWDFPLDFLSDVCDCLTVEEVH